MLVLSRQRDQSVTIADDITVTVVDIRGDKVRLGLSAPSEYQIHRKEIYTAILEDLTSGRAVVHCRKGGGGHLVLSRQRDESLVVVHRDELQRLADSVEAGQSYVPQLTAEIVVVDIRGDKVRLGFTAPREIAVHRKEVYDAIRHERRTTSQLT